MEVAIHPADRTAVEVVVGVADPLDRVLEELQLALGHDRQRRAGQPLEGGDQGRARRSPGSPPGGSCRRSDRGAPRRSPHAGRGSRRRPRTRTATRCRGSSGTGPDEAASEGRPGGGRLALEPAASVILVAEVPRGDAVQADSSRSAHNSTRRAIPARRRASRRRDGRAGGLDVPSDGRPPLPICPGERVHPAPCPSAIPPDGWPGREAVERMSRHRSASTDSSGPIGRAGGLAARPSIGGLGNARRRGLESPCRGADLSAPSTLIHQSSYHVRSCRTCQFRSPSSGSRTGEGRTEGIGNGLTHGQSVPISTNSIQEPPRPFPVIPPWWSPGRIRPWACRRRRACRQPIGVHE